MMSDNIVTHLYIDMMLSQPGLILHMHIEEGWSGELVTTTVVLDSKMGGSALSRIVCCLVLVLVSGHAYNYKTFFQTQWVKL